MSIGLPPFIPGSARDREKHRISCIRTPAKFLSGKMIVDGQFQIVIAPPHTAVPPPRCLGKQKNVLATFDQGAGIAARLQLFARNVIFDVVATADQDRRDTMFFRQRTKQTDDMACFMLPMGELLLRFHEFDIDDGKFEGRIAVMQFEFFADILRAFIGFTIEEKIFAREIRHRVLVFADVSDPEKPFSGQCGGVHALRHEKGGDLRIGDEVERKVFRCDMIEVESRQSVEFAFFQSADRMVESLESRGDHFLPPFV